MGLKDKDHTELPYNPAILRLGICLKKARIWKDTGTKCVLQQDLQEPRRGSNEKVHQQMNGLTSGTRTQWNTTSRGKTWKNVTCSNIDGSRDNFSWLYLSPFPQNHTLSHPLIISQFLPVLLHQTMVWKKRPPFAFWLCPDVHDLSHHQLACSFGPHETDFLEGKIMSQYLLQYKCSIHKYKGKTGPLEMKEIIS